MSEELPTVAIGLPVRNGSRYVEGAVRSVLAQDHHALKLLISDNASTDGTVEICERLVGDRRVEVEPLAVNIGAAANFNRVFDHTTGPFFAWAAHDDRFHPDFVSGCLDALLKNPDAAFAVPGIRFIDEADNQIGEVLAAADLASTVLRTRLKAFLARHEWFSIYGLWRRDALAATSRMGAFYGSDVLLQWEALLCARAVTLPEILVDYRRFASKNHEAVLGGLLPEGASASMRWAHVRLWRRLHAATLADRVEPTAGRTARAVLYRWLASAHFRELLWSDVALELGLARARSPVHRALWLLVLFVLRPRRTLRNLRRFGICRRSP